MNTDVSSLLIGIMVMLAIYLALSRVMDYSHSTIKKASAIFSGVAGLLSTFWLRENPDILGDYTQQIVLAGLAVVIALLAFLRKSLS